ncbi:MAG: hypothetical protein WCL39_05140 [Armatimonadota bacterium]
MYELVLLLFVMLLQILVWLSAFMVVPLGFLLPVVVLRHKKKSLPMKSVQAYSLGCVGFFGFCISFSLVLGDLSVGLYMGRKMIAPTLNSFLLNPIRALSDALQVGGLLSLIFSGLLVAILKADYSKPPKPKTKNV